MSFAYALLALNLLASRQLPPYAQLRIRRAHSCFVFTRAIAATGWMRF